MTGLKPPPDVPAARLFRTLLRLPRPIEPIGFRFEALPGKPLFVQALSHSEVGEARDSADPATAMVAAALVSRAGQPLVTVADLGLITETESERLQAAVLGVIARVSPSYALSDVAAWDARLREGANDGTNLRIAFTMGGCLELVGRRIYAAPEKFFGVARGQLLDGHWMAFRAAQSIYEQRRPKG